MDLRNSKESMLQRIRELELQVADTPTKSERAYFNCLELALKYCTDWSIGKKPINNAEGYCKLAEVFADNSIGKY